MSAGLTRLRQIRAGRHQEEGMRASGVIGESKEPGNPFASILSLLAPESPSGDRNFLPRPLGHETESGSWILWEPLLVWLFANHPEQCKAICEAEEILRRLEQQGVTSGPSYIMACKRLARAFEQGRRVKLRETIKVGVQ
jgi:hypothetical protein